MLNTPETKNKMLVTCRVIPKSFSNNNNNVNSSKQLYLYVVGTNTLS